MEIRPEVCAPSRQTRIASEALAEAGRHYRKLADFCRNNWGGGEKNGARLQEILLHIARAGA